MNLYECITFRVKKEMLHAVADMIYYNVCCPSQLILSIYSGNICVALLLQTTISTFRIFSTDQESANNLAHSKYVFFLKDNITFIG